MVGRDCKATALVGGIVISLAASTARAESAGASEERSAGASDEHAVVAREPDEGHKRWFEPSSRENLGEGALINIKVDRMSVPYTEMMVATQTLGASGIPVHLHTFEDEVIYVVKGRGTAVVGDDRREVRLAPGSVLYIPTGQWHGLKNADRQRRMEILLVTTPAEEGGLADYFRNAGVLPGHPPLDLSEEEFLALFGRYGMEVPDESDPY